MPKKKTTKSEKKKVKRIQVCPRCNSPDIETDFSNAASVYYGALSVKICNNCKHKGTFFPTVPISNIKNIKKPSQIKNKHLTDTTFAKGYFNITFLIISLLFIISGLIMIYYKISPDGIVNLIIGLLIMFFYLYRRNKMRKF